ncbi:MAG: hypothetical protein KatS3mg068_1806 [Candidatus Sericytochromatia bacterium]|nr:MAG: hypothetical protein KatS3mg068_1806 [Candidatus Sericytochromatia bacterium]
MSKKIIISSKKIIISSVCALNIFFCNRVKAEENKKIESYKSNVSGNFNIKTWFVSNSVDQFINILNPQIKNNSQFLNTKLSNIFFNVESNYWFSFITQNQLFVWGPLFGIGFELALGRNSFTNLSGVQPSSIDITAYLLNFSFAKVVLLHDNYMRKFLTINGIYSSYNNFGSGSNPFNGLGIGIDTQYNINDLIELFFKFNYIPNAPSGRFSNVFGLNSELGFKFIISPKVTINTGYKAFYYSANTIGQTTGQSSTGENIQLDVLLKVEDIMHGAFLGTNFYF